MDILFVSLLNMSIRAGWLILAVVIVRTLFRDMPKWIRCVLWGLVAVRLICPYTIESRLSLVPDTKVLSIAKESESMTGNAKATQISYFNFPDTVDVIVGNTVQGSFYEGENGEVSAYGRHGIGKVRGTKNAITKYIVSFVNTDIVSKKDLLYIAEIAWLIGVFALLVYAIVNYIKLKRCVAEAIPICYVNQSANTMIADAVKTPFILGIIRPKIYIPSDIDDAEMKYILAHETAHIRRKDHLWKLLGYLILTAYCFNPLVWLAYFLFCHDLELACDENVISKYDDKDKKSYSETLLICSMQRKSVLSCPLAFGEIAVKERIKAVMKYKKTKISIMIASIIICAVLAVCFLTNPVTSNAMTIARDDGKSVHISIADASNTYEEIEAEALLSDVTVSSGDFAVQSEDMSDVFSKELLDEYAKFGLTYDENNGKMMYKGKKVKFFYDGTGDGKAEDWFSGSTVLYTYVDEAGEVYIHTVRDPGHFDDLENYEMGRLLGIKEYSREDIKKLDINAVKDITGPIYTYAYETSDECVNIAQFDSNGKCVSLTSNPAAACEGEVTFTFKTEAGQDSSEIYHTVTLRPLTVSERFKQYKDYDITYKEAPGKSGKGNVYYKGELVGTFSDVNKDKGAFTYQSADKGNIDVSVIYNSKGDRIGIEVKK